MLIAIPLNCHIVDRKKYIKNNKSMSGNEFVPWFFHQCFSAQVSAKNY